MPQRDKIEALLGFAVRASKLVYGIDNIVKAKKRFFLLVLSSDASDNLKDAAVKEAAKRKIAVIQTKKPLHDIIPKQNCKLAALADKGMSEAIKINLNDGYSYLGSEVKI
ncbi:MAG: hypothetical protein LBP26_07140 [Clostridiales bacterium]|jgi:ribosomal protein L7Ae-like RNA K-turn-binding protein|nr:hypothetical protein [Clostridiales bacterium]